MQRIALSLTVLLSLPLLASACVEEESDPTTEYFQLAEQVAIEADLDDWEMCAAEDDEDIDAPACPDRSETAATDQLLPAEDGNSSRLVDCGANCCFFWDTWDTDPDSYVTICCATSKGTECEKH